jgi:hypothetical protein
MACQRTSCLTYAGRLLLALAMALLSTSVLAERYALIVGVGTYPLLGERARLRGPGNDVSLTRAMLLKKGFSASNVIVLSDAVTTGGAQPTRASILASFETVIAKAKPGDFVFFLYSGHGSQEPRVERAGGRIAVTGMRQIILPMDAGSWDDATGKVRNTLDDEELTAMLERLLAKGAFVWSVFDSCHSATLMRGMAGDDVRYRRISPDDLGVPRDLGRGQSIVPVAAPLQRAYKGNLPSQGGYVSFYAAQTNETTPDLGMPPDASPRRFHGLFIYTIVEALEARGSMTYRQVSEHVLGRYAARNITSPTPLFTGSHLDAPVFGIVQGNPVPQWRIQREGGQIAIRGGSLQQLGEGAILAIVRSATAPDPDVLGYLEPISVEATRTQLRPIAFNGQPAMEAAKIPAESYARLVRPSLQFGMKVRAPGAPIATSAAEVQVANQALAALRTAKPAEAAALEWVKEGQPADLILHMEDSRIWLLPPDGQLRKEPGVLRTPSIAIGSEIKELQKRLASTLQKISRTTNLLRVAQGVGGAQGKLDLGVKLQKAGSGAFELLDSSATPSLSPGDLVEISMKNRTRGTLDVTLLFIDAGHGIDVFYPSVPGASNRLEPGAMSQVRIEINAGTVGRERLVAIAVQAEPTAPRYDFSYLKQPHLDVTRGGRSPSGMGEMLERAAFGGDSGTRSGRSAGFEATEMRMFSWNTVEKPSPSRAGASDAK